MNTQSLQEMFPDVYRDFFSRNPVVLSGKFSLPWGPGGYGLRSNFAFITSKINLTCYLGFKKIKGNNIIFKNIISYDIVKKGFISEPFSSISKEEDEMKSLIKDIFQLNDFGLEIEILSETTRGHSFGFFGTFVALLSTGIYYLSNKIQSADLFDYDNFVNSKNFKEIFEKGLKLEYLNRYRNTIGQTILY